MFIRHCPRRHRRRRRCAFLVSLMLSATLMIIKRFVVVTKSHWHILWADVALLLPASLPACLPRTWNIITSWVETKLNTYRHGWALSTLICLRAQWRRRLIWHSAELFTRTHYFDTVDATNRTLIHFVCVEHNQQLHRKWEMLFAYTRSVRSFLLLV